MKLLKLIALILISNIVNAQVSLYVAETGQDKNNGSIEKPFKTLEAAVTKAMSFNGQDVTVFLRKGTYSPGSTVVINASEYKCRSMSITAFRNEQVTVSGAMLIHPVWKPYKNGIFQSGIKLDMPPDRLFMSGSALVMARFPNFDSTARIFNGTSAEVFSKERVAGWKNPAGGYLHALHQGEWGGFHYLVTGKNDAGEPVLEGGWQNNRPAPMHKQHRFVENIFEELDAPGEWYYDRQLQVLYVYPPAGHDINKEQFYVSRLNELVTISGTGEHPVKNIRISNISFTATNRTFMLTKEPLLRSDWTIYRGGAILLDGTENVRISNCIFKDLGGNAVFVSNYNRDALVENNHIFNIGASAIAFVGNADAVRSPAFRYEEFVPWNEMDFTPGPKTNNYPKQCTARGNLIHNIGQVEKQVAGVEIAMASHITIAQNTIYEVPRAGINIGDGCWGGHVLEFNDVFYTVLETGDHGAFNSWGRDRFWRPERVITDSIIAIKENIDLLDAVDPVTIRNNRFQCEHGWDIDLDDGSSNYHIYNNVCLNGGLKLREGFRRIVTNNIIINNTFHPHVWYEKSKDVFSHNIVSLSYAPIGIKNWGSKVDANFFLSAQALQLARANGTDSNSISGDPHFVDPAKNDFRVKAGSAAFKAGFTNFPMQFGVTSPVLKKLAKKAPVPSQAAGNLASFSLPIEWLGSKLKNIETLGERSAAGIPDNNGVLVVAVQKGSLPALSDLHVGDVILKMGDRKIISLEDFMDVVQKVKWMGSVNTTLMRNQQHHEIVLQLKK